MSERLDERSGPDEISAFAADGSGVAVLRRGEEASSAEML